jgi:hypothetical protein
MPELFVHMHLPHALAISGGPCMSALDDPITLCSLSPCASYSVQYIGRRCARDSTLVSDPPGVPSPLTPAQEHLVERLADAWGAFCVCRQVFIPGPGNGPLWQHPSAAPADFPCSVMGSASKVLANEGAVPIEDGSSDDGGAEVRQLLLSFSAGLVAASWQHDAPHAVLGLSLEHGHRCLAELAGVPPRICCRKVRCGCIVGNKLATSNNAVGPCVAVLRLLCGMGPVNTRRQIAAWNRRNDVGWLSCQMLASLHGLVHRGDRSDLAGAWQALAASRS